MSSTHPPITYLYPSRSSRLSKVLSRGADWVRGVSGPDADSGLNAWRQATYHSVVTSIPHVSMHSRPSWLHPKPYTLHPSPHTLNVISAIPYTSIHPQPRNSLHIQSFSTLPFLNQLYTLKPHISYTSMHPQPSHCLNIHTPSTPTFLTHSYTLNPRLGRSGSRGF